VGAEFWYEVVSGTTSGKWVGDSGQLTVKGAVLTDDVVKVRKSDSMKYKSDSTKGTEEEL
jgi:hypothetical protein